MCLGRIVGAVVILEVAVNAGRAGQVEVAIHMALRALQASVRPGERETRAGVVERRARPGGGGVAHRAVLGEAGRLMRRTVGALVVR